MTAVLFVIGAMILSSWQVKQDKIHGAASVEYVDSENLLQDTYIDSENDKQDVIILRVQDEVKEKVCIREFESVKSDISEIRKQTNEIYKLLIPKK